MNELKFKDFKHSINFESFQKNKDVIIVKIDTVVVDVYIKEWVQDFRYQDGYEKQARTRVYYKNKIKS